MDNYNIRTSSVFGNTGATALGPSPNVVSCLDDF